MNRTQITRLRNLVRILNEADAIPFFRSIFTMRKWGFKVTDDADHSCGTPACSMGHYAARTDIQHTFILDGDGSLETPGRDGSTMDIVSEHFGISERDREDLFGSSGSGNATRPKQAATYIETFTDHKEKEYVESLGK